MSSTQRLHDNYNDYDQRSLYHFSTSPPIPAQSQSTTRALPSVCPHSQSPYLTLPYLLSNGSILLLTTGHCHPITLLTFLLPVALLLCLRYLHLPIPLPWLQPRILSIQMTKLFPPLS